MSSEGVFAEAFRIVAEIEDRAEKEQKKHGYTWGKSFPDDHELGFLENILASATSAQGLLAAAKSHGEDRVAIAFLRAFNLAQAAFEWWEEFGLGDLIAPTVSQQEGRVEGGTKRGKQIEYERAPEWKRWQAAADKVWKGRPGLSKAAVARTVAIQLKLAEKPGTVAKKIKKSART